MSRWKPVNGLTVIAVIVEPQQQQQHSDLRQQPLLLRPGCVSCVCVREIVLWWHALCFDTSLPVYWWNNVFSPRLYFELPVMERRFDLIPRTILTPAGTDERRYLWQRRIDIYSASRDLTVSGIVFRGELSRAPA